MVEAKIVRPIGDLDKPFKQKVDGTLYTFDPAVSPASGTTTALGNVGGTTLIDNTRTEASNHWNGQLLVITSGVNVGQVRSVVSWDLPSFTFTVSPAFEGQVIVGISYIVLANLAPGSSLKKCNYNMAASTTTIVSSDLIGFGDDFFNTDWVMIHVFNDNAHGAAPEGDVRDITAYVSATGTFTTVAFSANVEANDYIIVARRDAFLIDRAAILAIPVVHSIADYVQHLYAAADTETTYTITIANSLVETQIFATAKTTLYDIVVKLDLGVLETAVEGGVVTIRAYEKIDGVNYTTKPEAALQYTVGTSLSHPVIFLKYVRGLCKITIQCSLAVTANRVITYRYTTEDKGA